MNYYEHHLRDYDADTSHLSWDEDMAYSRMLRWYYRKERALPADVEQVCRLVRAATDLQRQAVSGVLQEFFDLREDGWHQHTCDEVIAAFRAGEPEREAKKKNEDTRLARHRAERADLFSIINGADQHLPYNAPISEVRALAERIKNAAARQSATPETPPATLPATPSPAAATPDSPSVAAPETPAATSANESATQPATATATPATATQYPLPTPQYPLPNRKEEEGGAAQFETPSLQTSLGLLTSQPPAYRGDANEGSIPKRAKVQLAKDWELPEAWGTDAEALGFTPPEILLQGEKFRQYWVAGNGAGTRRTLKGWRQAWSNWLGKAERFRRTP